MAFAFFNVNRVGFLLWDVHRGKFRPTYTDRERRVSKTYGMEGSGIAAVEIYHVITASLSLSSSLVTH